MQATASTRSTLAFVYLSSTPNKIIALTLLTYVLPAPLPKQFARDAALFALANCKPQCLRFMGVAGDTYGEEGLHR